MIFIIGSIVLVFVTICFILLLMVITFDKYIYKNKESDKILRKFEPDNVSPELSDMIQYHKDNGIIEYEI